MFKSITQNKVNGSLIMGTVKRTIAPQIWNMPYSFSAFTHLSAIIPAMEGINNEAIPIVENIAPNSVPDQCFVWNQYAPIVISHEPQIKNCKKFITIRRNLIFFICLGLLKMVIKPFGRANKNQIYHFLKIAVW